MNYADKDDVKNYFLSLSFGTTNVSITDEKVDFYLDSVKPKIDDKLILACDLPITDADDLIRLKALQAKWAAGIIDQMRFNEQKIKVDEKLSKPRNLIKEAMDELDSIVNGETAFKSITKSNVASGVADLDFRDMSKEDTGHAGSVHD